MNILFLTHQFYPDIGGIEVNSEVLASEFLKAGHWIRLVTWSPGGAGREFPYPVIRKPDFGELFRQHRWADVIYENNPCLRLSWPAALLRKPSVVALRTWVSRGDGSLGFQDRLKLRWLRRAKRVIAVSEAVRRRCWNDAEVIGNPYRSDEFYVLPKVERVRDFVFLGRLVSDKGADIAIDALHRLVKRQPPVDGGNRPRLTIIGDGPERPRLEAQCKGLGLAESVVFTGALRGSELVACLNQHRFLLVPSRWEEPFGNVALEGMACGCIPIASDGGGLPDAVGDAGITFTRGDVGALVDAMVAISENSDLAASLRSRVPAHLATHLPEVVARRYLDVIEEAVHHR